MKQLSLAFLVMTVLISVGLPLADCKWHRNWEAFKVKFGKTYTQEEEMMRKVIFLENVVSIYAHNEDADKGEESFKLGINKFADLTVEEFSHLLNGFVKELNQEKDVKESSQELEPIVYKATVNDSKLPDKVDWREKNVVTNVKDQKRCGSCWAFSAAAAIEGAWAIKTGELRSLSAQNLLDCANRLQDSCNGGDMEDAFEYVRDNGINSDACYPYRARQLRMCHFRSRCVVANITNYAVIEEGDEAAMKQAVALVGPISAAFDADSPKFQYYKTGVYRNTKCSTIVSHGILIIGYGTEANGQDYWLAKNSWGTDWGNNGTFKIARNENMCGISNMVSFPIV